MYHCCKSCQKCCTSICDCCDQMCSGICKCLADCCNSVCKCLNNTFQKPFSFFTFLSFFLTCGPFLLAMAVFFDTYNVDCKHPLPAQMFIQGIINLVNFLFTIYIFCYYNKYQNELGQPKYNQMTVWQKTSHLILYDYCFCVFIFFVIFEIAWTIAGFQFYSQESSRSSCFNSNDPELKQSILINLAATIVYLVVAFLTFVTLISYYSCEEGSCLSAQICCCFLYCFTCGQCKGNYQCCECNGPEDCTCLDIICCFGVCGFCGCCCQDRSKKYKKNYDHEQPAKQQAEQNRAQYSETRNTWLRQTSSVAQNAGWGGTQNYQQQPNQFQAQYYNYPPMQQQPQYPQHLQQQPQYSQGLQQQMGHNYSKDIQKPSTQPQNGQQYNNQFFPYYNQQNVLQL